jgi:hypothetical protein
VSRITGDNPGLLNLGWGVAPAQFQLAAPEGFSAGWLPLACTVSRVAEVTVACVLVSIMADSWPRKTAFNLKAYYLTKAM